MVGLGAGRPDGGDVVGLLGEKLASKPGEFVHFRSLAVKMVTVEVSSPRERSVNFGYCAETWDGMLGARFLACDEDGSHDVISGGYMGSTETASLILGYFSKTAHGRPEGVRCQNAKRLVLMTVKLKARFGTHPSALEALSRGEERETGLKGEREASARDKPWEIGQGRGKGHNLRVKGMEQKGRLNPGKTWGLSEGSRRLEMRFWRGGCEMGLWLCVLCKVDEDGTVLRVGVAPGWVDSLLSHVPGLQRYVTGGRRLRLRAFGHRLDSSRPEWPHSWC